MNLGLDPRYAGFGFNLCPTLYLGDQPGVL
jgi:hypothetical protein